ncbi:MAG: hypothetical protein AAB724_01290, partial [Patescibacteria group bacterium]
MSEKSKIPTQEEIVAMRTVLEAREAVKNKNKVADLGVVEKSQTGSEKKQEAKGEVDWGKSAILGAEGGWNQPEEVDMSKSAIIAAEAGGFDVKINEGLKNKPEKPGASEKTPIELTEAVKEPEKESKLEATLAKAREDYVAATMAKEKAGKEENKLTGIRGKIKEIFSKSEKEVKTAEEFFVKVPGREEKISGAKAETQATKEKLAQNKKAYEAALKNYRLAELSGKEEELKKAGKSAEEIKVGLEKISEQILRFTTLGEFAKIED